MKIAIEQKSQQQWEEMAMHQDNAKFCDLYQKCA